MKVSHGLHFTEERTGIQLSIGFIFWLIMLLWLILGIVFRTDIPGGRFGLAGGILSFILFFLLGWRVFGFIIQG